MSDNIIEFKTPPSNKPQKPAHPPLLNLPPVTKALLVVMIAIHAILYLAVSPETRAEMIFTFGFIPSIWTGNEFLDVPQLSVLSPLSYMFLHGNWMHIAMNGAMLMAFGAGVEKIMGGKKYLLFFILCGLISLLPELLIHPASQYPIIGASGAESGLFAAILIILQSEGRLPTGKYGIWPFAILWIGISVLFGLFGGLMAGGPIAWLAHLGGFIGGFILLQTRYFRV